MVDRTSQLRPHEVEEEKFQDVQPQQPQRPVLSRRTQKWVDQNSDWWGVDEEMTAAAMGLDKKLAKQYGPDYIGTKEYFKTIDKTMRKRFPEFFNEDQEEEDDPPPTKRSLSDDEEYSRRTKPASVVAPATRSTPPNRVKLKASEATIARRLGVPIEEYAKQVALLRRG